MHLFESSQSKHIYRRGTVNLARTLDTGCRAEAIRRVQTKLLRGTPHRRVEAPAEQKEVDKECAEASKENTAIARGTERASLSCKGLRA